MSGLDYVQFNTLERALSSDLNNTESMKDRALLDMLREQFGTRTLALGSVPTESPRDVVMGGFELSPAGSDVSIAPGVLLQENAALVPVPGSLDSSYRYAKNQSATTVAMPAPGSDSYVLIEAAMTQVVTLSELRDIWDPITRTFTPSLVNKLVERRAQFFTTTQATTFPPPLAGRVPIAAVFRPAGGGPVLASHIIDLRPLWNDLPRQNLAYDLATSFPQLGRSAFKTASTSAGSSNLISISAHAFLQNGREVFFTSNGDIDITAAAYTASGYSNVANSWRYLYLCSWRDTSLPANWAPTGGIARGILVISNVAPTNFGDLTNGATITLPNPWNATVPAGHAVCVGALLRSAANDGWVPMWSVDGRVRVGTSLTGAQVTISSPTGLDTVNVSSIVPKCARSATWRFIVSGGAITDLYTRSVGGGTYPYDGVKCDANAGGVELAAPLLSTGQFDVDTVGTNPTNIIVYLASYAM